MAPGDATYHVTTWAPDRAKPIELAFSSANQRRRQQDNVTMCFGWVTKQPDDVTSVYSWWNTPWRPTYGARNSRRRWRRVKNNSFCQISCQPTKIDPKVEIAPAGLALRRRKSTSPGRAQAKTREWPTKMANRETEDQQKLRFQVELEFVQCLANPNYLNFLAQRGYFKDPAFVNYLKYLQYWKEPEYARYLKYPMCLYFLELLQHDHFRKEIVNAQCTKFIDEQQLLHWQHYTRKRMRLLQAQTEHSLPNLQTIKREN